MIKKEEGVLTTLSKGINSLTRDNTIGGMRFVEEIEERVAEKVKNARMEHLRNSLGMNEKSVSEDAFKGNLKIENTKIGHLEKSLNMKKMSDPKKAFKKDEEKTDNKEDIER